MIREQWSLGYSSLNEENLDSWNSLPELLKKFHTVTTLKQNTNPYTWINTYADGNVLLVHCQNMRLWASQYMKEKKHMYHPSVYFCMKYEKLYTDRQSGVEEKQNLWSPQSLDSISWDNAVKEESEYYSFFTTAAVKCVWLLWASV